jgi:hypothetical protein
MGMILLCYLYWPVAGRKVRIALVNSSSGDPYVGGVQFYFRHD